MRKTIERRLLDGLVRWLFCLKAASWTRNAGENGSKQKETHSIDTEGFRCGYVNSLLTFVSI